MISQGDAGESRLLVDQAIFTSLARRGKAGYHLVSRSEGLAPSECAGIEAWAPSHGAMISDPVNTESINFHQLVSGRYALSRTIEGRPEYSGRGRQLYTQFLVMSADVISQVGYQPFSVYRDALAQGIFFYKADPPAILPRVQLSRIHFRRQPEEWEWLVRNFGQVEFDSLLFQLGTTRSITLPCPGDRAQLAEALLCRIEPEKVLNVSFATNLQPSTTRPLNLQLVSA